MAISPPILTATDAEALNTFLRLNAENARLLERLEAGPVERFPAAITAINGAYSPPRYSWYEQAFDNNGNRYTKPDGRSGTAVWSPAFGYGDGSTIATADMPLPVTLTRRVVAVESGSGGGSLGPVYEFPAYCGCIAGSGSGSGAGGFVLVACCPNPIPTTLHGTITTACGCFSGQTFTLTYDPAAGYWSGGPPADTCVTGACHATIAFRLRCLVRTFGVQVDSAAFCTGAGTYCVPAEAFPTTTTASCDPLHVTVTGTFGAGGTCSCSGQAYTLTITE